MNILMLGWGKAGSWQVRGEQLGAAIGARVTSTPSEKDWHWADLAVIVKRAEPRYGPPARAAGVPIVWDALDCWRQPADNSLSETDARALLRQHLSVIRPALTIGATQAMAQACGGVYLPHHSWPGLEPGRVREHVQVVAYQGAEAYLGRWHGALNAACAQRGWRFVVNPADLRTADILVALRDGPWDGWMCREWKSGIKLGNAIAAGRPVITQDTAARREIQPAGTVIASVDDLSAALDDWTPLQARRAVVEDARIRCQAYRLPAVAARYRQVLAGVPLEVSA